MADTQLHPRRGAEVEDGLGFSGFDAGNPESLFYAALELRMGIEARLLEILRVLLRANN